MPEALTHLELLSAQRLQRRGLLLRKIAAELGVSFGAVCLALYGDNQSSNAVKPAGEASDDEADVLGRAGSSDDGAGFLVPTDHLVAHRLPNFFWRGTAEQLSAVRRRKPEWAHLKPVAVS